MGLTNRLGLALAGFLLLGAAGCQKEHPVKTMPVVRTAFEEALSFGDVYALADGGAYLRSYREGIFYIANGVAERVVGLPPDALGDVTALADGSALFQPSIADPPKLYWLRGATAKVVTEGHIVPQAQSPVTPQGFLFAENQRLKRQLDEMTAMQGPDGTDYEAEPY